MPIIGILASAITGNLALSVNYLVVAGGGGGAGNVKLAVPLRVAPDIVAGILCPILYSFAN